MSDANPALTIEEILSKYNDRWVAMVVTKRDANLQPIEGIVVADDSNRYKLRDRVIRQNDICIFFAGDPGYPILL